MKDNTTNQNENPETIESAALKLQSIFNLIKHSALHFEGQADIEIQEFFGDVMNACDIGKNLAYEVWKQSQEVSE